MKKSLIKSLLPVLVVVLVLSVATISVMADTVLGPYYCPEKEGCTYYITLFDGLGRTKTPLDPDAPVDYYAMGIGDALEAGAAVEYYAMGIGDALEAEAAVEYYAMGVGEALEADAPVAYYAMGTGDALEAGAAVEYYAMGTGEALDPDAAVEYWDGYHVFVQADCDGAEDDIDGLA